MTFLLRLLLNRYTLFVAGLYLLSLVTALTGGLGGPVLRIDSGELLLENTFLELSLQLYLYAFCNQVLRPSRWQAGLAALPLLLLHLGQELYYLIYSRVFRLAELASVPELCKILPPGLLLLLIASVALPLGCFLWQFDVRKWKVALAGMLPLLVLIGTAELAPEGYTAVFQKAGGEIIPWDDASSVEANGRLMMLLYREAERQIAKSKTNQFRNRPLYEQEAHQLADWIRTHNESRRNVHLIVLESFLDPALFRGARFTKDPMHPSFKKLFGGKLGLSVSPVVGGGTSQAEFEVLCGVPAFGELNGAEFNSFTGAAAYCLPGLLASAGYHAMASNAYNPSFFNTPSAYRGIGFAKAYFPKEYVSDGDTYLSTGPVALEDDFMFDGEIFTQNLAFITPLLKQKDGPPLFNYVLTVYGHTPHTMDPNKRPPVLRMIAAFQDEVLERSANQFYYRTQAIAAYVQRLIELDPKSLILLVSDHVPPGQYGKTSYEKLGYLNNSKDNTHMNRILVVEDGKAKKYATVHHYDLPALVFNYLTKGAYCRDRGCGFAENRFIDDRKARHEAYMRVMAHVME